MTSSYDDIDALVKDLRTRCEENKWTVMADGCVRSETAAMLMGVKPRTFEDWRRFHDPRHPKCRRIPTLRYHLRDIAIALLLDAKPL